MLRTVEARQHVADLMAHFTKASNATNSAVMADTDERSQSSAAEARLAAAAAQIELDAATRLLSGLGYEPETQQLRTFADRYRAYVNLQAQILDLAVENTNLKAQRLSLGAAFDAADETIGYVDTVAGMPHAGQRQVALAAQVAAAVREIQALQAPHIADARDTTMTRLEDRMSSRELRARRGLAQLGAIVDAASKKAVAEAGSAFDHFMMLHHEIIRLSRRNTNVRSLSLALHEKGTLTVACEEALSQVRVGLDGRTSYGTR